MLIIIHKSKSTDLLFFWLYASLYVWVLVHHIGCCVQVYLLLNLAQSEAVLLQLLECLYSLILLCLLDVLDISLKIFLSFKCQDLLTWLWVQYYLRLDVHILNWHQKLLPIGRYDLLELLDLAMVVLTGSLCLGLLFLFWLVDDLSTISSVIQYHIYYF